MKQQRLRAARAGQQPAAHALAKWSAIKYSAEDDLLWTVQKYANDFRSKLTLGVIPVQKRHKTTKILRMVQLKSRFRNSIFMKLMFNCNAVQPVFFR